MTAQEPAAVVAVQGRGPRAATAEARSVLQASTGFVFARAQARLRLPGSGKIGEHFVARQGHVAAPAS